MKKNTSKQQARTAKRSRAKQEETASFAFHIGMDLGDQYSDGCVLDSQGEIREQIQLRMKAADLQAYFAAIPRSRVALEAGGQSRWVAEVIERCGHQVYVADPRRLKLITEADDKNDAGDAYKLAELVHFKPRLLHAIQHRSEEQQADLSWIRAREALVASRTQLINTVRGMSKGFGERLGKCSAEAFSAKRASELPEAIRGAAAPLLEVIDQLNEQIRYYDQMEEHIARERYPKYWLLEQVNGVGVHTALTYMLTIGDAERFAKSRTVGCYVGLRPRQKDSGESQPQLGISKAGNEYLRKTLVNCAHYILGPHGRDSDVRRCGLRICERGGKNAKKRAVVAVARKLAVLLHRLWVSGEVYEPLRNSERQKAAA